MNISYQKMADDYIKWVNKHQKPKFTNFLDPIVREEIEYELKKYEKISYKEDGGYENAERKVVAIFPAEIKFDLQFPITAVAITTKGEQQLTHRDYLGAILGLGLARDKIGDIIVVESKAQIIVMEDIKDYIINNISRVGNLSVTAKEISINEIILPEEKYKDIFATVSSLRLDSIASAAFNISRSKMAELIRIGRAKVNWKIVDDVSYSINVGDMISIQGRGRARVDSIDGKTAKGRIKIHIKRFI